MPLWHQAPSCPSHDCEGGPSLTKVLFVCCKHGYSEDGPSSRLFDEKSPRRPRIVIESASLGGRNLARARGRASCHATSKQPKPSRQPLDAKRDEDETCGTSRPPSSNQRAGCAERDRTSLPRLRASSRGAKRVGDGRAPRTTPPGDAAVSRSFCRSLRSARLLRPTMAFPRIAVCGVHGDSSWNAVS